MSKIDIFHYTKLHDIPFRESERLRGGEIERQQEKREKLSKRENSYNKDQHHNKPILFTHECKHD